jgi:CubicO group peptidase (beta-lactamase class C family)
MSLDTARIDGLLEAAVEEGVLPGAVVVIADRDGLVYEGAAGKLSEGGPAVTPDTMFRYASCTKALASVAALQLIERGRIGLDDDVASVRPEFAAIQVLEGFDGDQPILRAPSRQATIRELLTHTSGLAYFFTSGDLARYHEVTGVPHVLTGEAASLHVPMAEDPGTIWAYGTNTDWVGLVVEAASGLTLDAYLAEHVTGPLGMTDTTFQPSDEQRARMMAVHARTADGGFEPSPIELAPDPDWWSGGHGLCGTGRDYAHFIQMLLREGEFGGAHILESETVALAFSDQLRGVPMPQDGIVSAFPELANDVPALPFDEAWGLGFHLVLEDIPGMRRAGSGDWAGIFNLYYWIDRAAGVGGMLLTQVLPFFDMPVVETFQAIEAEVYAQLVTA